MVKHLPPMTDMRLTPSESEDEYPLIPTSKDQPAYPYGLCISLCEDELEKLGIDPDDVDIDDILHIFAFGVVTSKSVSQRQDDDPHVRIEIQLTHIAGESEDDENEEEEEGVSITGKLYTNK